MPISAPRRRGEAERRVEPGREAEADAGLLDAAQHAGRRQLDDDAERLEHVGRAAQRRRRPGAVLAHRHAGPGDDDGGHRRHVDRVRAVAARADDVDGPAPQLVVQRHQLGRRQHGVEQPGQLVGRLALGPQRDDEADQLGRRGVAAEDRRHRRSRLVGGQVAPGEQLGQQARPPPVAGPAGRRRRRGSRPGHYGAGDGRRRQRRSVAARADGQALRRRWRMMRRRSRSVAPPHTPAFSREARACSRQATRTAHPSQTDFATVASSSSSG